MPEARPPSSGRAAEIAVPRDGMKASAMPTAATSEGPRTSTAKSPFGEANDSQTKPPARMNNPATVGGLKPNRAITRGATPTISTMIVMVIGSSAAPPANAPKPSTC